MLVSAVITASKGLYLPYLLDASRFGYYSIYFQLVSIFAPVVAFGIPDAFFLEYQKVQNFKNIAVAKVYSYSFYTVMLVCFFSCLALYIIDSLTRNSGFSVYVCLTLFSQVVFFWLMRTLRFKLKATKFAFYNFLRAAIDLSLIFFIGDISLVDIFYIEAFSFIIVSMLIMVNERIVMSNIGVLSYKRVIRYIRVGFLIVVSGFLVNLLFFLDRVFVSYFFSSEFIGRYNILLLPMSFSIIFYNIFYQYFLPKINSMIRIDNDIKSCRVIIRRYQQCLFISYVVFVIPAVLLFKYFVDDVYDTSFSYIEIFLLSVAILLYLLNIYDVLYLSLGKIKQQVLINSALTVIYVSAVYFLYFFLDGLSVVDLMILSIAFKLFALLWHYKQTEIGYLARL